MCEICNASGYTIRDGCPKCGIKGDIGVYHDGSGCWKCAPEREVDGPAVIAAFMRTVARG